MRLFLLLLAFIFCWFLCRNSVMLLRSKQWFDTIGLDCLSLNCWSSIIKSICSTSRIFLYCFPKLSGNSLAWLPAVLNWKIFTQIPLKNCNPGYLLIKSGGMGFSFSSSRLIFLRGMPVASGVTTSPQGIVFMSFSTCPIVISAKCEPIFRLIPKIIHASIQRFWIGKPVFRYFEGSKTIPAKRFLNLGLNFGKFWRSLSDPNLISSKGCLVMWRTSPWAMLMYV